jgi:cell division protein FtsQ
MSTERSAMNAVTRFFLGVIALAALGASAWYGYTLASSQPIRSVVFTGDADKIPRADLERLAEGLRALPAGAATLAAVREAAKRIPWVRDASARRQFPDAMVVRLEAFQALARWNEGQLVSTRGEVFPAEFSGKLPRFSGPDGTSAEMTREYASLAAALAPLGIPIVEVKLSARGAWQIALESGLVLELGRGDMAVRVARFAAAWPRLPKEEPEPKYADLRYPNGFAVRRTKKS